MPGGLQVAQAAGASREAPGHIAFIDAWCPVAMCVCMYVCTYVRTYVCMYVCMDVWMYGCIYGCVYVYINLHVCVYIYIYMYVCREKKKPDSYQHHFDEYLRNMMLQRCCEDGTMLLNYRVVGTALAALRPP